MRHAAMVLSACRRELVHASDADDAAQAFFIICAQRAEKVSPPHQLGAWLFGVAMRVCKTARRSRARRRLHETQAGQIDHTPLPSTSSWEAVRPQLNCALQALRPAYRELIIAHYLEGVPQGTVAARLGITSAAATMRIHYALGKLRDWFAQRGVVLGEGTLLTAVKGPFSVQSSAALAGLVRTSPSPWIRAIALHQLELDRWNRYHVNSDGDFDADIPPPITVTPVAQELRSRYSFERWFGMEAIPQTVELKQPIDADIQKSCVRMITSDPDPRIRHYALTTAYWNEMKADEAFISALHDADPKVRLLAIRLMIWRLQDHERPFPNELRADATRALAQAQQTALPQSDSDVPAADTTIVLSNGKTLLQTAGKTTMDFAPEWTPADFGETDPSLFPDVPTNNG